MGLLQPPRRPDHRRRPVVRVGPPAPVTNVGGVSRASECSSASTSTPRSAEVDGRLEVTDDFRIRATLPLFEELLARVRRSWPAPTSDAPRARWSRSIPSRPCVVVWHELCPDVELLENLRFNPGEETNDPAFGASLVEGFDYYINEAFSASHRAHASIMIPPTLVPSAAGPNLQREVATLTLDPGGSRATLRGHRRRGQGQGQARHRQGALAEGRPGHRRRRHGLHLRGDPGSHHRLLAL